MKKKLDRDYQLIIGVCRDEGVIIDITYNGVLNNLTNDDLIDVYKRLSLLKKEVSRLIRARVWEAIKSYFRRD